MTTTITGNRTSTTVGSPAKRLREPGPYQLVDFEARDVGEGVVSVDHKGPFVGLLVADGTVTDTGRVVNQPYSETELSDVVIRNVHGTNLDSFVRFKKAKDVLIEDCSGYGSATSLNGFPSGVFTSEHPTSDHVCRRVTMSGFRQHPKPSGYWNGDGFANERKSFRHLYEDCVADDNADAGYDLKGHETQLVRCSAARNGRNYRLWGDGIATDIVSIDPRKCHIWFGGGGNNLGDWTITRPVFVGGSDKPHIQVDNGSDGVTITVVDPVLPPGEELRVDKNENGRLVTVDVVYTEQPPAPPEPEPEPEQPVDDSLADTLEGFAQAADTLAAQLRALARREV